MENERPTGDDARQFSKATRDLPEIGQLTPEEAAQLLEDMAGRPVDYGSTNAALAAMEKRLAALKARRAELLNQLDEDATNPDLLSALNLVRADTAAANAHLAAYREQARHKN